MHHRYSREAKNGCPLRSNAVIYNYVQFKLFPCRHSFVYLNPSTISCVNQPTGPESHAGHSSTLVSLHNSRDHCPAKNFRSASIETFITRWYPFKKCSHSGCVSHFRGAERAIEPSIFISRRERRCGEEGKFDSIGANWTHISRKGWRTTPSGVFKKICRT